MRNKILIQKCNNIFPAIERLLLFTFWWILAYNSYIIQVRVLGKWTFVIIRLWKFSSLLINFLKILNIIHQLKYCFVHLFDLYWNMGLLFGIITLLTTKLNEFNACLYRSTGYFLGIDHSPHDYSAVYT